MRDARRLALLHFATLLSLSALASGQTLIAEHLGVAAGDTYGSAVAAVGDVDADGTPDWAVGAPTEDLAASDAGLVIVYSGATQAPLHTWRGTVAGERFGGALAGAGDVDGDGHDDVLVGSSGAGWAQVFSGDTGLVLHTLTAGGSGGSFGAAVAGGSDLSGDGVPDLLVGEHKHSGGGLDRGRVHVFNGATGLSLRTHNGTFDFGELGRAVAFLGDLDGDGLAEYAAGAPGTGTSSGESEVCAYDGASGVSLWTDHEDNTAEMYGFALASIADLNGDGVRDLLAGAPQDPGVGCGPCNGKGFVRAVDGLSGGLIYQKDNQSGSFVGYGWSIAVVGDLDGNGFEDFASSRPGTEGCTGFGISIRIRDGETGALLLTVNPPAGADSFGASLAFADVNGDGLEDLLCGSPCSDLNGVSSGAVYAFTAVRRATAYCEAQLNSLGCTPTIGGFGTPSATIAQPFRIKAFQVLNNKNGLLFYGFAPKSTPFLGGTLCVQAPTKRTPVQDSTGNPPPNDCSGFYSYDFNDRIRSGVDPALVAGEEVFAQYWSRDPLSGSTTGLTDALAFYINP